MGVYSLYGDYLYGLQRITLTLFGELHKNCSFELVAPNTLSFSENSSRIDIKFENLIFAPASAEIKPNFFANCESISLSATCSRNAGGDSRYSDICKRILNGDMLRCKFCDADIANIANVTEVDKSWCVDSLDGLEPVGFFCHTRNPVPPRNGTPLSKFVSTIPSSHALCNGTEAVFNPDVWISCSLQTVPDSEGFFCRRCKVMLGRLVGEGSDAVNILWTINSNVWTQEFDADGDYLRHVTLPLIQQDIDFFELLFSQMLKAKRYRIILSAGSHEAPINFALIWLFDQRSCLYSATIDMTKASPCESESSGQKESTETMLVVAEETPILRVFYRFLTPNNSTNPPKVEDALFDEWNRDLSVSHLRLPVETCVMLSNCLSQITQRLPPQLRCGSGQMEGFTIGGVPMRA